MSDQGKVEAFAAPSRVIRKSLLFASPEKNAVKTDENLQTFMDKSAQQQQQDNITDNENAILAVTGTVNERLKQELAHAAAQQVSSTPRSSLGQKLFGDTYRASRKTEQERANALKDAQNLNGVNPIVAMVGAVFSLTVASCFWYLTNVWAEYTTLHPLLLDTDFYIAARVTAVVRGVITGLVALASGFWGVTGIGLLLLGVRVTYGVYITGELDPTPLPSTVDTTPENEKVDWTRMWKLMTNQRQRRQ